MIYMQERDDPNLKTFITDIQKPNLTMCKALFWISFRQTCKEQTNKGRSLKLFEIRKFYEFTFVDQMQHKVHNVINADPPNIKINVMEVYK